MKKNDVAEEIMKAVGLESKKQSVAVVEAFWDVVVKALSRGEEVKFPGFGVFRVADRAAREGINPKTGEKIHIAASKKAKFRVGKLLKEAVK